MLYAVSTPDELIDAYDAPESIDHVGETVFVVSSLSVAKQEYVELPPEFTFALPVIETEESVGGPALILTSL